MNTPTTLILGLLGFEPEQEAAVQRVLSNRRPAPVEWSVGNLPDADAWWVHGARVRLLGDGSLRIGAVHLALPEVRQPIAFSRPLASPALEPAYAFDFADPAGMAALLCAMESRWVEARAAKLWLAEQLAHAHRETQVYHVVGEGRLLAVIDGAGSIGLMPGLVVAHLLDAAWVRRPAAAAFIPPSFQRTTVSELMGLDR